MGDDRVYAVVGVDDQLEEIFSGRPLPILVETVMLIFKGKIIYDGVLRPYNLYFGAGIRSGLKEEYLTAKQNGRIITSLESEIAPAKPPRQERGQDKKSEAALTEIVRMSENIRGGSAIQSA